MARPMPVRQERSVRAWRSGRRSRLAFDHPGCRSFFELIGSFLILTNAFGLIAQLVARPSSLSRLRLANRAFSFGSASNGELDCVDCHDLVAAADGRDDPETEGVDEGSDGNAATVEQIGWRPLLTTPNHPEYPAAHGCFSGAVVETLRTYFGTDSLDFAMTSAANGLIQPVRRYHTFSGALTDILNARIYGGMHFRNSTVQGAMIGKQVAQQMLSGYFLPQQD